MTDNRLRNNRILLLWQQGKSSGEIAQAMCLSKFAVKAVIKRARDADDVRVVNRKVTRL